jgi:hypothetical protein
LLTLGVVDPHLVLEILIGNSREVGGRDLRSRRVDEVGVGHLAAAHQRGDLVDRLISLRVLLLHVLVARGVLGVET